METLILLVKAFSLMALAFFVLAPLVGFTAFFVALAVARITKHAWMRLKHGRSVDVAQCYVYEVSGATPQLHPEDIVLPSFAFVARQSSPEFVWHKNTELEYSYFRLLLTSNVKWAYKRR